MSTHNGRGLRPFGPPNRGDRLHRTDRSSGCLPLAWVCEEPSPTGSPAGRRDVPQDRRVQGVGLGQRSRGPGEVAHPARVDHHHRQRRRGQGQRYPMASLNLLAPPSSFAGMPPVSAQGSAGGNTPACPSSPSSSLASCLVVVNARGGAIVGQVDTGLRACQSGFRATNSAQPMLPALAESTQKDSASTVRSMVSAPIRGVRASRFSWSRSRTHP